MHSLTENQLTSPRKKFSKNFSIRGSRSVIKCLRPLSKKENKTHFQKPIKKAFKKEYIKHIIIYTKLLNQPSTKKCLSALQTSKTIVILPIKLTLSHHPKRSTINFSKHDNLPRKPKPSN